jgi:AbrB family looped-hinge helix DNA binding protein
MKLTKITAKGQITLPVEVRESLVLQQGEKVEISDSPFTKYVGLPQNRRKEYRQSY